MRKYLLGFVLGALTAAGVAFAYNTDTADTYMKAISNLDGVSAIDCTITDTDGGVHVRRAEGGKMQTAYAQDRAP